MNSFVKQILTLSNSTQTLLKKVALSASTVLLAIAVPLVAQAQSTQRSDDSDEHQKIKRQCIPVGGMLMTNFINENTTLGTVTGDLRGAVSATLLGLAPGANGTQIGRVRHRWVTEAGDFIFLADGEVTLVPIEEGVFHATYKSISILGGTGKFKNARGFTNSVGSADLKRGETVFRYRGEVCFAK